MPSWTPAALRLKIADGEDRHLGRRSIHRSGQVSAITLNSTIKGWGVSKGVSLVVIGGLRKRNTTVRVKSAKQSAHKDQVPWSRQKWKAIERGTAWMFRRWSLGPRIPLL